MPDGLRGKRVLVTRARGQNEKFSRELAAAGDVPVEFPTIQIVPPADFGPLDRAITDLAAYHWLIFTSVNGVDHFWQRLLQLSQSTAALRHIRVAAIGPATAAALRQQQVQVDLLPAEHVAEAPLAAIGDVAGRRILLPTADIARSTLAAGLRASGASVDQVTAYQTQPVEDPGHLLDLLPAIDILTFTSGSTVRNFVNLLQTDFPATAIGPALVACIGPVTAQTAQELGLPVHIVAETYTITGLIQALENYQEEYHQ